MSLHTDSELPRARRRVSPHAIEHLGQSIHEPQEVRMTPSITVLVADDHMMVRQGMSSLLRNTEGIRVAGEAADGSEAIAMVQRLKPDVAMIDVRMSALNGVDATTQIIEASPHTAVLAISAQGDPESIENMFRAGAQGYLVKDTSVENMINAIRSVARGETFLCPQSARQMIDAFVLGDGSIQSQLFSVLTPREREVAQLLSEGHSTRDIAGNLHVSIKTIDTHRYQILKKLDLRGIADLTRLALKEGLSTLENSSRINQEPSD